MAEYTVCLHKNVSMFLLLVLSFIMFLLVVWHIKNNA